MSNIENIENKLLEIFAIVELFGHTKIAGKVTEQNIAGTNMLRVDVPETSKNPGFTRFFGNAAIYAINPVTEEIVNAYAERLSVQPIQIYDLNGMVEKKMLLLKEKEKTEESLDIDHLIDDDDDNFPYTPYF